MDLNSKGSIRDECKGGIADVLMVTIDIIFERELQVKRRLPGAFQAGLRMI